MSADSLDAALKRIMANLDNAGDAGLRQAANDRRKRRRMENAVALIDLLLSQKPKHGPGEPDNPQAEALAKVYASFRDRVRQALDATAEGIRA